MKYEEIKLLETYVYGEMKHKVVFKDEASKTIFAISELGKPLGWEKGQYRYFEPLPKELPEEGLLVSEGGSLVYKLSDGSGYGFSLGNQSDYYFNKGWNFSDTDNWQPATEEQETKFIEMLKKECEKRGLFEDTKIEAHADSQSLCSNSYEYLPAGEATQIWNKNGVIFNRGRFAKPLKESTLDQVTDAVKNIANFTIEESPTGLIILTPINK